MASANRAFFDRWFNEVWNKGDFEVAQQVIDPNFTVHGAGGQSVKTGPDGVTGLVKVWREAFKDGKMVIHDVVSENDLVAIRMTWEGTNTGEFYGIPANNKRILCTSIGMDRVTNGRVSEGWGELDMLGMMQQLGAAPSIGQNVDGSWYMDEKSVPELGESSTATMAANKDLLLRYMQAINDNNEQALRSVVASGYTDYNPTYGKGDAAFTMRNYGTLRAAMPDLHYEVDRQHMLAEGDRAFCRWVATGTYNGAGLYGSQPNGKKLEWTGSELCRTVDGKIAQRWHCADMLTLMQQAGVVPTPGA